MQWRGDKSSIKRSLQNVLPLFPSSLAYSLLSSNLPLSLSLSFWLPDSLGSLFPNPMSFSAFAYQMGYRETHTHIRNEEKKSEVQPASSSTERQYRRRYMHVCTEWRIKEICIIARWRKIERERTREREREYVISYILDWSGFRRSRPYTTSPDLLQWSTHRSTSRFDSIPLFLLFSISWNFPFREHDIITIIYL